MSETTEEARTDFLSPKSREKNMAPFLLCFEAASVRFVFNMLFRLHTIELLILDLAFQDPDFGNTWK